MECILNKVDPQFETTQGYLYRLSILLCPDGFSFLVTHAASQKVLKIASYKLNVVGHQQNVISEWPADGNHYFEKLGKVDLTQISYKQVQIAIASHKISVLPHGFLGDVHRIMEMAYPVSQGEEILTEPVFDHGPLTAMLLPQYIKESCARMFPSALFRCASSVFVKSILRKYSGLIRRHVFINVHPGFFEIAIIQGLRLLYLNAFRYSAPSDVLYYVIFVLEQLGIIPSEEKITLMGDIDENSVIATQLKMYCDSLSFTVKPDGLEYGEVFAGISMHNHFILLNIPICE